MGTTVLDGMIASLHSMKVECTPVKSPDHTEEVVMHIITVNFKDPANSSSISARHVLSRLRDAFKFYLLTSSSG